LLKIKSLVQKNEQIKIKKLLIKIKSKKIKSQKHFSENNHFVNKNIDF